MVNERKSNDEPVARYDGGGLGLAEGLMFALDVCLSDIHPGEILELSGANAGLVLPSLNGAKPVRPYRGLCSAAAARCGGRARPSGTAPRTGSAGATARR